MFIQKLNSLFSLFYLRFLRFIDLKRNKINLKIFCFRKRRKRLFVTLFWWFLIESSHTKQLKIGIFRILFVNDLRFETIRSFCCDVCFPWMARRSLLITPLIKIWFSFYWNLFWENSNLEMPSNWFVLIIVDINFHHFVRRKIWMATNEQTKCFHSFIISISK